MQVLRRRSPLIEMMDTHDQPHLPRRRRPRPTRWTPGESDVWVTREQFLAVLDSVAGRDDVRITFDDGNASDVEHALPALRERGLNATFFVVAGRLGDARLPRRRRGAGARGRRDDDRLPRHAPPPLARPRRATRCARSCVDAKAMLEAVVERPVTQAACPFGSYDRRVLRTPARDRLPPRVHERSRHDPRRATSSRPATASARTTRPACSSRSRRSTRSRTRPCPGARSWR